MPPETILRRFFLTSCGNNNFDNNSLLILVLRKRRTFAIIALVNCRRGLRRVRRAAGEAFAGEPALSPGPFRLRHICRALTERGGYFRLPADERHLNCDNRTAHPEAGTAEPYTGRSAFRLDVMGTAKKLLATDRVRQRPVEGEGVWSAFGMMAG